MCLKRSGEIPNIIILIATVAVCRESGTTNVCDMTPHLGRKGILVRQVGKDF